MVKITFRSMNAMFEGRRQQDAHELLRCILTYIQDAVKQLNLQRQRLRQLAQNHSTAGSHASNDCCPTATVQRFNPLTAVGEGQVLRNLTDRATADISSRYMNAANFGNGLSSQANEGSCSVPSIENSSSVASSNRAPHHKAVDCNDAGDMPDGTMLNAKQPERPADVSNIKKMSAGAGIVRYFSAAAKPKSMIDLKLNVKTLRDFVEDQCQGISELRTRCLECEQVTRQCEEYQDIALPVKKPIVPEAGVPDANAGNHVVS